MKQRFSALDVSAQVAELRPRLVGLPYDINARTYLFKFSKPDFKEMLLVESGVRMHSTEFARDKSNTPSHFCMKIRKHLRTRRVTAFDQLGADRVVDMRFGDGEHAYHLILEFYASGNVILTDHEYRILSLLRVVEVEGHTTPAKPDDGDTKFAVGEIYDVTRARPFEEITEEKLHATLEAAVAEARSAVIPTDVSTVVEEVVAEEDLGKDGKKDGKKSKAAKKKSAAAKWSGKGQKKGKELTLKKVIRDKLSHDYGPAVVDHCMLLSGLDLNAKITPELDVSANSPIMQALLPAFRAGDAIVKACIASPQKGWITLKAEAVAPKPTKPDAPVDATDRPSEFIAYEEFYPFLFRQFDASDPSDASPNGSQQRVLEYATFDKCVDEFYSKLEAQKLQIRARQAELNAAKKLESVKAGHYNQVRGLNVLQEQSEKTAQAIEANLPLVESIINTFRSFIASGMDWTDLEELVKDEKKKGNPVASVVTRLRLDVGMVTIQLRDAEYVDSEDEESDAEETDEEGDSDDSRNEEDFSRPRKNEKKPVAPPKPTTLSVDLDIYTSAYANARRYYDTKKVAAVKQDKTVQAAEKAYKSAERKIEVELKSTQQTAPAIVKMRKPFWFEKFLWFISSENYLVVGGRDAAQNELLVKRYLRKGDAYVHADLHGAASVIVKNIPDADAPPAIPPTTLHQAGTMSVCQSRAWDAKIVMSAWWVEESQVSKTAPTGEYLTTGSFMIRGKKNWLPPVQLVYGFAILFRVDESCAPRHYYERRPWRRDGGDSSANPAIEDANDHSANQSNHDDEDDIAGSDSDHDDGDADDVQEKVAEHGEDDIAEDGAPSEHESDHEEQPARTQTPDGPASSVDVGATVPSADKYELDQDDEEEEEEVDQNAETSTVVPSKKRVTAKERRDMRKQRAGGGDGPVEHAKPPPGPSSQKQASQKQSSVEKPQEKQPVRGKKGKIKKLKGKYADQDEEDRELMLELLGSRAKEPPAAKVPDASVAAKSPPNKGGKRTNEAMKKQPRAPPASSPSQDEAASLSNPSAKTQDESASSPSTATAARRGSQSEIVALLAEENILQLPDDSNDTSYLDNLTGQPHHTDVLLHAVPVCAPWSALTKYKYKAKLVPGTAKKGRAVKTLVTAFCSAGDAAPPKRQINGIVMTEADVEEGRVRVEAEKTERELVKSVPEMEMMTALLGKVKVVVGQEASNKSKKKGPGRRGR
ncbi:hypothetical protein HKX48_006333 [Thoreauomyces humboldtii]|nr:hypothetical protein HKX48_006333 [Thoreauomyces humboldtii]